MAANSGTSKHRISNVQTGHSMIKTLWSPCLGSRPRCAETRNAESWYAEKNISCTGMPNGSIGIEMEHLYRNAECILFNVPQYQNNPRNTSSRLRIQDKIVYIEATVLDRSCVIRWQLPDFLSDSNSNVCSLTIYEIFANQIKCQQFALEMKVNVKEKNGTCAI